MSVNAHPIIKRLRVKNFKSLRDVDVTLGSLNVLVGRNGAGKSNLIDALRFVRDALIYNLDEAVSARNGIDSIRHHGASSAGEIEIEIQIDLEAGHWSGAYGFCLRTLSDGMFTIVWEIATLSRDGTTMRVHVSERFNGVSMSEFEICTPPSGTDLGALGLGNLQMDEWFTPMSDFLKDMGFYHPNPGGLREPQKPTVFYPLRESSNNLASVLRHLERDPAAKRMISEALTALTEDVVDFRVEAVGGYLVTYLHHHRVDGHNQPFELDSESDGTLRLLGILTALYQQPTLPLLAIEEPELNIHPGALEALCELLKEAGLRQQVLLTTHSPDLIETFPAEAFLVVDRSGSESCIGPLMDKQTEAIHDRLFTAGELQRMEGLKRKPANQGAGSDDA